MSEHSFSFVIILPLAIWLAPLLSLCHWQLCSSPLLVTLFLALELDTVALLSVFKNLTIFSGFGGMANPLQMIYNEYEIQIGVESASISVFFQWTIASVLVHND